VTRSGRQEGTPRTHAGVVVVPHTLTGVLAVVLTFATLESPGWRTRLPARLDRRP
jgi:hypothetical protein